MKRTLTALALLTSPLWAAEEEDAGPSATFERYEIILERMPFGNPPPDFNPDAPPGPGGAKAGPTKEEQQEQAQLLQQQQQLLQQLKVTMLNVTPAGDVAVGFNVADQHYYLLAGQEKDGWKVSGADLGSNEVTFQKDDIEVSVKLGSLASGSAARAKTPVPSPEAANASNPSTSGGESPVSRLRLRRQRRQEQMEQDRIAAEAAAQRAKDEEAEKARLALQKEQEEQEKRERDAEMKEQREQLLKLAEELKKQRQESEDAKKTDAAEDPAE